MKTDIFSLQKMRSRQLVCSYFKNAYRTKKTTIWAFSKVLGVASIHTQSRLAKNIN